MIKEIKKVIEELKIKHADLQNSNSPPECDSYLHGYIEGIKDRIEITIFSLEQVVNKHETKHTYRSNGSGENDTEGKMEG